MEVYPERQKRQKNTICVLFQWKISFSLYPARYYATPRHNPRSDFYKNGLKSSPRLEKNVKKFQRKKNNNRQRYNKKCRSWVDSAPPPGSFRVKKTKLMLFGTNQYLYKFKDISLIYEGVMIERVEKFKYLGVLFDPQLSWDDHVNYLSSNTLYRSKRILGLFLE